VTGTPGAWARMLVVPSVVIWAIQVVVLTFICKRFGIPRAYALTTPLGLSLFYTALLVSVIGILRRKGPAWKDRRVYERPDVELCPPAESGEGSSSAGGKGRVDADRGHEGP
jgi:hypothetical protein